MLDTAERTLSDPRGGYFDVPKSAGAGLLSRRDKSLEANVAMANAQLSTGDIQSARRTLATFGGSYPMFGTEAAAYARAVERLNLQKPSANP